MPADFTIAWPLWACTAIILVAVVLYATDRVAMELVSAGLIASFLLVFQLPGATGMNGEPVPAATFLAGFANSALLTIMALLVVGQGLFQTGALDSPSRALMRAYDRSPTAVLLASFLAVFVISAFLNNTPVVVMFLPIMSALAARMGVAPSRVMMPLSFVSVLAGITTLIGTSTNLLAADIYQGHTGRTIGFFDLTPIGLALAGAGALYIALAARFLLPERTGLGDDLLAPRSGRQFIIELEITRDHPLLGASPVAGQFADLADITVRLVQREGRSVLPPFDGLVLQAGDTLILAATRKAVTSMLARRPGLLREIWQASRRAEGHARRAPRTLALTEAVVAPGSRLINRSPVQSGPLEAAEAIVLGIQRRSRMVRAGLAEVRLEQGDTLLLGSPPNALNALHVSRDLLLLEGSRADFHLTAPVLLARLIAFGVVLLAASGLLPILHASLAGAVAMIATGCLNVRQAARALDLRVYLLIAAAIAMGAALEITGGAALVAHGVIALAEPFGPIAMLSLLFLVIALLTSILSNAATAVLFMPIALSTATESGLDPLPFAYAVIFAANCSFATPIAYQTNLLVMGPGHYRFGDYVRFGTPLIFILWAVFTLIASWRFGPAMT